MLQIEKPGVKSLKLKRAFLTPSTIWKMFHITEVQALRVGVTDVKIGSEWARSKGLVDFVYPGWGVTEDIKQENVLKTWLFTNITVE